TTPQTITATDSADAFTSSATTNAATRVATSVVVEVPETAATGVPTRVEVEGLDQAGQAMRDFTGPATVSSTDTTAKGPPRRRGARAPPRGRPPTTPSGATTGSTPSRSRSTRRRRPGGRR